jgi:hypothetical protein
MAQSSVVGALRVTLGLDSAEFEKGLKRTQETLGGLNLGKGLLGNLKAIEGGLHETAGSAGVAGSALAKFGAVGLVAGAALGGFVEVMKKAGEAVEIAAGFAKLSKEVGVSTDFIQQFNFAARQSDVDVGKADEALKSLNVSMGLVEKGLARKQLANAFAALGFTPEQLRGFKDAGEFLPALADAITKAGNASEQAAIAKRLGVSELLPLLKDGGKAFNRLAQEARDLGIVMDEGLIQKAEEAEKKLKALADITKARANVTFVEFADTLILIKTAFADAERAALHFLAAITGTTSIGTKIEDTTAQLAALQKRADGKAFEPAQQALFNALNARLKELRFQQGVAAPIKTLDDGKNNPPATGAIPGKAAASNAGASDEAVARARKGELEAQQALTRNVAALAVLRQHAVDVETADANKKLADEASAGKITKAAAAEATALNDKAAIEKKQLIVQQARFEAENQALAHAEAIAGYEGQIADVEASLARSAEARGALEAKALADRQAAERARLATETEQKRITGQIDERQQAELAIEQLAAQAAQRKRLAADTAANVAEEANRRAEAALELQIDILQSAADAADTDGKRLEIRIQILKLEQELELLKLQEVIDSKTSSDTEKLIAAARKRELGAIDDNQLHALVGGFSDSLRNAESAVGGLASAFKSHDWGQVASQLVSTVQSLSVAFGPNGTLGSKIGAAAGVGQAVGSAVGGVAGSTISGIAGGASLGFTLGGPVGAAVGAVLGGIAGFLSGSSAKKAQQAADAKAAAEAAAAHAQSVANEALQLRIQLLDAEGKTEEANALRREQALAGVNAENRELEAQLLDLQEAAQKAAEAAAHVAQVTAEGHALQIQLLELTGDATGALNARRADELAALDAANRGLQQEIFNLQDLASARADAAAKVADDKTALVAARDAEAQALTETVTRFQQYADSLNAYRRSLDPVAGSPTSASLSGLAAQFRATAARAQLGDEGALGSLQGVAEQFRAAGVAQAHTAAEAKAVEDKIRAGVGAAADTAGRTASIAQQQLTQLKTMVEAELGTTAAVQSVEAAVQALHGDLAALAAFGPAVNTIANLALAEGSNIIPLAPLPVAPSAPSTSGLSPVVDASLVGATSGSGLTDPMVTAALAQIARNTGTFADNSEQWTAVGIPTVAAA